MDRLSNDKNRELIEEETEDSLEWIIALYISAYNKLYRYLNTVLDYKKNPGFTKVGIEDIYKHVDFILKDLQDTIEETIPEEIERQVGLGFAENYLAYLAATGYKTTITDMFNEFADFIKVTDTSSALAGDTMKDLLAATNNTSFAVKELIRKTFSEHLAYEVAANKGYSEIATTILNKITGGQLKVSITNGVIAIVDKAGRRWKLSTYIEMVVKTKYHKSRVEGMRDFYRKTGYGDLAVIPRNGALDACRNFEGMIISLTGENFDYPSYDDLWATGMIFHPRCRHTPKPIFSVDSLHPADLAHAQAVYEEAQEHLE